MTLYRTLKSKTIWSTATPPDGAQSILLIGSSLLPSLISDIHKNFRAWGDRGLSPGPLDPARVFVAADGALSFAFPEKGDADVIYPQRLAANIGAARDLAGWLILLDKWMETFVVLARARRVWTPNELASALPYMAPIYQPASLIEMPPANWERVARALASVVSDGELAGGDDELAGGNEEPLPNPKRAQTSPSTPAAAKRTKPRRKKESSSEAQHESASGDTAGNDTAGNDSATADASGHAPGREVRSQAVGKPDSKPGSKPDSKPDSKPGKQTGDQTE